MNTDKKLEIERSLLGKKVKLLAFYRGNDEIDYEFGIVNEVLSIDFDRKKLKYYASRLSLYLFDRDGNLYAENKGQLGIGIPSYVDFQHSEIEVLPDNCYPLDSDLRLKGIKTIVKSLPEQGYSNIAGSLNPVAMMEIDPDLTLTMLERTTNYQFTAEQRAIAKMSAIEAIDLAHRQTRELTVRDLVKMWDSSAALQEFAGALKKIFLLR